MSSSASAWQRRRSSSSSPSASISHPSRSLTPSDRAGVTRSGPNSASHRSDRVVALVARLVPIKRVDRFLRMACALAHDPSLRFLIVGDGELRGQLQSSASARRLGDRLVWAGFRRDMPAVCFASDVIVLTSDNEGTPVSLIEAQAAGTPVVSTRVGGVPSVVREGQTGFVVDPEDEQGLADAVARVLATPAVAERAAAAAGESAQAFSLESLVGHMDELYRRLLAHHDIGISGIDGKSRAPLASRP